MGHEQVEEDEIVAVLLQRTGTDAPVVEDVAGVASAFQDNRASYAAGSEGLGLMRNKINQS